jgi:hypothetical protein
MTASMDEERAGVPNRYPGWIHIPGQPHQDQITEIASYRQPA